MGEACAGAPDGPGTGCLVSLKGPHAGLLQVR